MSNLNVTAAMLANLANTVRGCAAKYHAELSQADVEDCIQDGIVKACASFDATRGDSETHAKVCTYQATVDFLRKRTASRDAFKVTEVTSDDDTCDVFETIASDATAADAALSARESINALSAFRATLGAKDAAMLDALLDAGGELDFHAYAERTGERLGTVKTRLSRLRAALRAAA